MDNSEERSVEESDFVRIGKVPAAKRVKLVGLVKTVAGIF